MLAEEGLENVWARHEVLAGAVARRRGGVVGPGRARALRGGSGVPFNAVTAVVTGDVDIDCDGSVRRRLA